MDARSVLRPVRLLRFQASLSQALPSPHYYASVRSKPSIKNSILVILSGVDEKFKNWTKLMDELRQFHPSLKISQIRKLPKGDFFSDWRLSARYHYITKRI